MAGGRADGQDAHGGRLLMRSSPSELFSFCSYKTRENSTVSSLEELMFKFFVHKKTQENIKQIMFIMVLSSPEELVF